VAGSGDSSIGGEGTSEGGDGTSVGSVGSSVAGGVSVAGGGAGSLVPDGEDGSFVVCEGGMFVAAGEGSEESGAAVLGAGKTAEAGAVELELRGWPVAISMSLSGREVTRPVRPSRTFLTLSSSTPNSAATWSSTCSSVSGRERSTASSIERARGLWASFNQVKKETTATAATITAALVKAC
jgi:hypothetical protein